MAPAKKSTGSKTTVQVEVKGATPTTPAKLVLLNKKTNATAGKSKAVLKPKSSGKTHKKPDPEEEIEDGSDEEKEEEEEEEQEQDEQEEESSNEDQDENDASPRASSSEPSKKKKRKPVQFQTVSLMSKASARRGLKALGHSTVPSNLINFLSEAPKYAYAVLLTRVALSGSVSNAINASKLAESQTHGKKTNSSPKVFKITKEHVIQTLQ